ncbi:UBX domain-containing protein 11 isoform X4 [Vidua chalybeata]|uniref:UBX domain-containing protein 11 isoform X4 n=1 Tax=Vidua chalybeata TaxID=81927 RepID=UPI0023A83917|nr:UBX domain-containing protein 11 isoform X4 [Vidua chalybeata]
MLGIVVPGDYSAHHVTGAGPIAVGPVSPWQPAVNKMAAGGAAHADVELMTSLVEKISLLEQKIEKQAQEIQLKDGRIAELQEKIKTLQEGEDASDSPTTEELEMRCLQLQSQVWEMERFLNDYGLVWVGEARHQLGDTESLWEEEELPAGNLCKPGEAVVRKHQIDFDLILENIKDLNSLVGEGISQIEHTARGARLRQPEPLPLTLYRNGIVVGHGAFRPYQHPATQQCLQDIMDGYFPSELQPRYPEGVPLQGSNGQQRSKEILVGTPGLAALQRVKPAEEAGAPGPDCCTLRVRSESGEQTYELRMLLTDTIGDLRQHLAHIRGGNSDYEIISTFPQRVYTDSSRSLQECGLVPRASLLLRRRDPSQQEGSGLQTA